MSLKKRSHNSLFLPRLIAGKEEVKKGEDEEEEEEGEEGEEEGEIAAELVPEAHAAANGNATANATNPVLQPSAALFPSPDSSAPAPGAGWRAVKRMVRGFPPSA